MSSKLNSKEAFSGSNRRFSYANISLTVSIYTQLLHDNNCSQCHFDLFLQEI